MIYNDNGTKNCSCSCLKGNIREKNEDNFYFAGEFLETDSGDLKEPMSKAIDLKDSRKSGHLFAVFDGMGGGQHGELAAYEAAKCTSEYILQCENLDDGSETFMLNALCNTINDRVYAACEKAGATVMGTTIAALYFRGDKLWSCNVGDSRCYRLRNGVLEKLSEDHVEGLYNIDVIRKKKKPGLIQYLGMDPDEILIEPTINSSDFKEGDRYLICSDGLTDMVADADIAAILRDAGDAEDAANKLVDQALANGGRDNITAIVCQC